MTCDQDDDTINLPSPAKVVKTGTTVWEPLRSAEVAVLEAADALARLRRADADDFTWPAWNRAHEALWAAVDARSELNRAARAEASSVSAQAEAGQ